MAFHASKVPDETLVVEVKHRMGRIKDPLGGMMAKSPTRLRKKYVGFIWFYDVSNFLLVSL